MYAGLSMGRIRKRNYFRQRHVMEQKLRERKEQGVLDIVCGSSSCRAGSSDKIIG